MCPAHPQALMCSSVATKPIGLVTRIICLLAFGSRTDNGECPREQDLEDSPNQKSRFCELYLPRELYFVTVLHSAAPVSKRTAILGCDIVHRCDELLRHCLHVLYILAPNPREGNPRAGSSTGGRGRNRKGDRPLTWHRQRRQRR